MITENLKVEIDELIPHGIVKMSTATFETIQAELEAHDTGHSAGNVAFIGRHRADLNEKFAREAAERRWFKEFGTHNTHAYEHYQALDRKALNEPKSVKAPIAPDELPPGFGHSPKRQEAIDRGEYTAVNPSLVKLVPTEGAPVPIAPYPTDPVSDAPSDAVSVEHNVPDAHVNDEHNVFVMHESDVHDENALPEHPAIEKVPPTA